MKQNQTERSHDGTERTEEVAPAGLGLAAVDPSEALEAATQFARENPHAALGAAAAVGFLLGGGLTPRLLAAAALVAGRRYAGVALRELIEKVAQDTLGMHAAHEAGEHG